MNKQIKTLSILTALLLAAVLPATAKASPNEKKNVMVANNDMRSQILNFCIVARVPGKPEKSAGCQEIYMMNSNVFRDLDIGALREGNHQSQVVLQVLDHDHLVAEGDLPDCTERAIYGGGSRINVECR